LALSIKIAVYGCQEKRERKKNRSKKDNNLCMIASKIKYQQLTLASKYFLKSTYKELVVCIFSTQL
jgi:hypothetical protein